MGMSYLDKYPIIAIYFIEITSRYKGPCNVNPAYRSLLYRFNILYLTRNLFHGGQPPNPRVRCALLAARNCWIFGLGVLIHGGQPLYPQVCYTVLVSICI